MSVSTIAKFALLNRSASIPALDFIASSITGSTRTVVVSRYWLYLMLPLGLGILALHIIAAAASGHRAPVGPWPPCQCGMPRVTMAQPLATAGHWLPSVTTLDAPMAWER